MAETAGIIHVFVAGFFYQRTYGACLGREFKYTICLMSALVVLEGNGTAVRVPFGTVYFILPVEEVGAGDDASSCFNFINARYLERKFVFSGRSAPTETAQAGICQTGRRTSFQDTLHL